MRTPNVMASEVLKKQRFSPRVPQTHKFSQKYEHLLPLLVDLLERRMRIIHVFLNLVTKMKVIIMLTATKLLKLFASENS